MTAEISDRATLDLADRGTAPQTHGTRVEIRIPLSRNAA